MVDLEAALLVVAGFTDALSMRVELRVVRVDSAAGVVSASCARLRWDVVKQGNNQRTGSVTLGAIGVQQLCLAGSRTRRLQGSRY